VTGSLLPTLKPEAEKFSYPFAQAEFLRMLPLTGLSEQANPALTITRNTDVGAPKLKLLEIGMVSFLIIVSPKRDRR
jgi:hypothetical protein